jgi:fluoroquinolone transport system ATP-binding protein
MHTADELCDRVSFIVDGELRITDTPENLKSQYGKEAVNVLLENGENKEFSLENLGENLDFINFLKKGGFSRIHTLEASLEEVFINVTGKSLQI